MVSVSNDKRSLGEALKLSAVGLTLAFCIAIGTGAGIWLDDRFGTQPALTVVGFFFGVTAGFVELFRAINKG